jgi:hypothetical protein
MIHCWNLAILSEEGILWSDPLDAREAATEGGAALPAKGESDRMIL